MQTMDVRFKGDLSPTKIKLKDANNACDSNDHQRQKEMDTIAHVFYQRVQNETEEFLQQITKYVLPPNDSRESHPLRR
ncbi:hypothetical protein J437_LFUL017236 [Ladona fulva]|uniref:Uncharacterized protein n=1 Tax=Ladona fulva TaxID=123851 RepID=A0A8K0KX45_LADFU|nr:hypothetical protein J437_LFUL017236 [Ladona fulva]